MRLRPLLTLCLLTAAAAAGEAGPMFTDQEWAGAERQPVSESSPSAAIAQLVCALGVVLAVAVAAGWALKRAGVRRFAPGGKGAHLRLIETVPIGYKRAVSLVRIGEQVLVVGQAEHGLTHLATLPASVIAEAPAAAPAAEPSSASARTEIPASAPARGFAAALDKLTGGPSGMIRRALLLIVLALAPAAAVEAPGLRTSAGQTRDELVAAGGAAARQVLGTDLADAVGARAPGGTPGSLTISLGEGERGMSSAVALLLIITALAVAPAFLMMLTCFTRIIIVLGFVRRALGTQTLPPNQVVLGLGLFLTLFVMAPTIQRVNEEAVQPWLASTVTQDEALGRAKDATRDFLVKHTRKNDLALFIRLAGEERPRTVQDVSFATLVPAFITSELKTAFQMGFVIFLPFLVIDLVISAVLMALGMMMLPPVVVSLPFKILLFVLVDGWTLLMQGLVRSYA